MNTAKDAKDDAKLALSQNTVLKQKITELENKNSRLEQRMKKIETAQIDAENYSRRENLIIEGVTEKQNENVENILKTIFTKLSVDSVDDMKFDRCHRLGAYNAQRRSPRAIIVRFMWFQDRMNVWAKRREIQQISDPDLTSRGMFMKEHFCMETEKNRSQLLPILKAAKNIPEITSARLDKDRLKINGASFTVENLNALPDCLKPENTCERQDENTLIFWEKSSIFSNFHPSDITIDDKNYNCVEQYFCAEKARIFNDEEVKNKIMSETNPAKQKKLGQTVKSYDDAKWKRTMCTVMENALRARFSQDEMFRKKLLGTRGKSIGEACAHDSDWGTSVSLHHKDALDQQTWKGANLLGKLLVRLRNEHDNRN